MIANVGLSTEGCLLSRTIAPADAETFLLPLIAPVIVEERVMGFPAPGDIVLLDAPMGGGSVSRAFEVRVLYDAPANLQVKIFRDRDRSCVSSINLNTCGSSITPLSGTVSRRPPDGRLERVITFRVVMTVPGVCQAIDLYVSPQFRDEPDQEHNPVRPGEVAHARWFVAVAQSNGDLPSLRLCNDRSAGQ